jgi:hypothetical protein
MAEEKQLFDARLNSSGPFEVIHTNANGTQQYCDLYGKGISRVSSTMKPCPAAWTQETQEDKKEARLSQWHG